MVTGTTSSRTGWGKELFDRAPQPKSFYSIAGAGHNNTYDVGGAAYWQRCRELVEDNF
jgi:fermentation-respiration switch protein FrsA (DUF1100 family)